MIVSQFDWHEQELAKFQGADLQPIVNRRIVRRLEHNDISVGLDAGLSQRGNVPLVPERLSCLYVQVAIGLLLFIL